MFIVKDAVNLTTVKSKLHTNFIELGHIRMRQKGGSLQA